MQADQQDQAINLAISGPMVELKAMVDAQADDGGLWFIAETAAEAYVQQELRKLHAAAEAVIFSPPENRFSDLLAACEQALEIFGGPAKRFPASRRAALDQLNAAIAKATQP